MQPILVYVTAASLDEAEKLASALVSERLAACANILDGVSSVFRWQGKIEKSREALCILKTTRGRFAALNERVLELHSYDTPCVTALPITDGNPEFLRWIEDSVSGPEVYTV